MVSSAPLRRKGKGRKRRVMLRDGSLIVRAALLGKWKEEKEGVQRDCDLILSAALRGKGR